MASDEKSSQNTTENVSFDTRQSPPKAVVDSSPLQPAINKNKEGEYFALAFVYTLDLRRDCQTSLINSFLQR